MGKKIRNIIQKRKRILIVVLIVIVAFYLFLVNFLVSAALIPSFMDKLWFVDDITEQSYDELVQTDALDAQYSTAAKLTGEWYQTVEKKELSKESADGYRLVATEFFPENHETHKWLLLLHGFTGRQEEMYPLARWYQRRGFYVISPDMRCQGGSEGDFIGMGLTDSEDNMLWINEILSQDPEAEIVLQGQSMGAACALIMSGRDDLPDNVKLVVSDCAYTDAYAMFCDRCKAWFHLPPALIVPAANVFLQLRGGYNLRKASAIEAVRHSTVPTLFFHGEDDQMIPVYMARELYEAKQGEKKLFIVPDAGHAQALDVDVNLCFGAIKEAIREYIK